MAAWADFCFGRKPAGVTRKISLAEVDPKALAKRARGVMLAWEAHCFGVDRAQALAPLAASFAAALDDWHAVRRSTVVLAR